MRVKILAFANTIKLDQSDKSLILKAVLKDKTNP